jgi:hypothetical protein
MPVIDLCPLSIIIRSKLIADYIRQMRTVAVYENTSASRKSGIYELLGPGMIRYMSPRYRNDPPNERRE